MLEGLPYVAILLLLLLLLLVLFLILLFIFLLCASRLSTRQSKVDGTLARTNGSSSSDRRFLDH
jgi:cell division septal protein FtsQ